MASEVEQQLAVLPRREIAAPSIADYGRIIVCNRLEEAIGAVNELAPEHLRNCDRRMRWK